MFNRTVHHLWFSIIFLSALVFCQGEISEKEINKYREQVNRMFYHAYDGYMKYAFPLDELRPLTCDGHNTWGSYSLTLIDALDTLAVLGNSTEFKRVVDIIVKRKNFDEDINVSVFETNIRIVGGLLSGHLLYQKMNVPLPKGWPCNGPLLSLAKDVVDRLLPAFDTPTGMPYGTVNFRYGVPEGETPVTCAAGVGTYLIEFGTLSRLLNDPIYEEIALRAMYKMWSLRSPIGLLGNHIDVTTGHWTAQDSGIGAGTDSFYEYLVKGAFLFQRPELLHIFNDARVPIEHYLRHDDWHLWATMGKGQVTMAIFQSLQAFWPGTLTMIGDVKDAQKIILNYHQTWKMFGFTPEFYHIAQNAPYKNRDGYPLRPELVESLVYLYQATKDKLYLEMGADLITSIEHSCKTKCGYATVKNVLDHSLENRMESFFLAETTKYLYLLFDEDHWLHNAGASGVPWSIKNRHCTLGASYFFNTEAHPMDTGALMCCISSKYPSNFASKALYEPSTTSAKVNDVKFDRGNSLFSNVLEELKKSESTPQQHDIITNNELNSDNIIKLETSYDTHSIMNNSTEEVGDENESIKVTRNNFSKVPNEELQDGSPASQIQSESADIKVKTSDSVSTPEKSDIKLDTFVKEEFSTSKLRKKLAIHMASYKKSYQDVSFSILYCKSPSYTSFLSKRGQVFR